MQFSIEQKIMSAEALVRQVRIWRLKDDVIVFTNGCFDLLHRGHFYTLNQAGKLGDRVIVALNSDRSVKALKGEGRPFQSQNDRAYALASLHYVDAVVIFDEETPAQLIEALLPDVLVKGGDYNPADVVGASVVQAHGGKVEIIPFQEGFSSSSLAEHIRK